MSFLDFLTGKIECPYCGTAGAKKSGEKVLCPNPACPNFDASLAGGSAPRTTAASFAGQGSSTPIQSISIRYRTAAGQEKTFNGDPATAERVKNHIRVRVAPKGVVITLSRDRIQNLQEVESAFAQRVPPGQTWPTSRERQILNYHKKRGSTSPAYESLRAKYPNW